MNRGDFNWDGPIGGVLFVLLSPLLFVAITLMKLAMVPVILFHAFFGRR